MRHRQIEKQTNKQIDRWKEGNRDRQTEREEMETYREERDTQTET